MLAFVLILVVLQLWLLTATMNAYLGGDDAVVWPAAVASLFCFLLNVGLLRYPRRLEDRDRLKIDSPRAASAAVCCADGL